jgi:hypothetical protein
VGGAPLRVLNPSCPPPLGPGTTDLTIEVHVDTPGAQLADELGGHADGTSDGHGVQLALGHRPGRLALVGEPLALREVAVDDQAAVRAEAAGQCQVEPVALLGGGVDLRVGTGDQVGEQGPGAPDNTALR